MQTDELLADKYCGAESTLVDSQFNVMPVDDFHHGEIISSSGFCFVVGKLSRIGADRAAGVVDSFLELWVIAIEGTELFAFNVALHCFEGVRHSLRNKARGCRELQPFQ